MKSILLFFFCLTLLNFCSQNHSMNNLEESNSIESRGELSNLLKFYKRPINVDTSLRPLNVQFFNNPYQLDSSYQLVLIINEKIIFQSGFKQYINIKMPSSFFSNMSTVKFILSKNKMNYIFNTREIGKIEELDDVLRIAFIPKEDDWFTFYFNFTKKNNYIEGP